jgi:hypothetical protein
MPAHVELQEPLDAGNHPPDAGGGSRRPGRNRPNTNFTAGSSGTNRPLPFLRMASPPSTAWVRIWPAFRAFCSGTGSARLVCTAAAPTDVVRHAMLTSIAVDRTGGRRPGARHLNHLVEAVDRVGRQSARRHIEPTAFERRLDARNRHTSMDGSELAGAVPTLCRQTTIAGPVSAQ